MGSRWGRTIGGFSSTHLPTARQMMEVRDLSRFGILPTNTANILQAISVANLDIIRYDTEIDKRQTRKQLERLTSEREALACYANLCRSALSPVHRMPNELLTCIFERCLPHDLYITSVTQSPAEEVDRIFHRHLLELSQVCFRWHHVVMETPQLWSRITVDTRLWDKCEVPIANLLRMLESSLDRGKQHPLVLVAYAVKPHHHSLLQLLRKHAQRWQKAYIWGDDCTDELQTYAGNFPQLKRVSLGKCRDTKVFHAAPLLQEVVLFNGALDNLPKLPWAQIQKFAYYDAPQTRNISLPALLSLFPLLTSAIEVIVALCLCRSSNEPLDLDITSSVLYVQFCMKTTAETASRFFEHMKFPCLRSFCMFPRDIRNLPVWNSSDFISLATRSDFGSCLTHLAVHAIVTDVELLRCLEVLPKLSSLSIADCSSPGPSQTVITDTLLRKLQCMSDTQCLLVPKLQVLILNTVLGFTDSVYLDLVRSRAESQDGLIFMADLWLMEARIREVGAEALDEITKLTTGRALIFNRGDWSIKMRFKYSIVCFHF
ncbi:hypothetical protein R3P38DRAFT_2590623 [Favolaschia claudopus]|uniref:F-box domain-containing protein n=1 Tax=Favolaschia claudopus TaxID=2862362 RepID=A0AAV9YZX0_9AGAR